MHSIILNRIILFIVTISLILSSTLNLVADEQQKKADDFKPNAPKQGQQPPPLNQLKQIIQGIFGQPKAVPARKANTPAKSKDPDYYRFPQDLDQERRFKSAQQLINDQQWEAAREKLQLMLENSINLPVHVAGSQKLIADRELIYQLLELLPVEQREKFNRQYEALAEKQFHDARLNESPPEIYAEIATRFVGTPFGLKAMNYLASYHMERGEFGLAEQYLQRLLIHKAPITKTPQWRTKTAFVFKQTGKQSLIPDLFQTGDEPPKPDQQIIIAGTSQLPQNWLNQQPMVNTNSNPLLNEWPMLHGSPSRAARSKNVDPLLIPRWSFPLTSNHTIQSQLNLIQEDLAISQRATVPALPPIAINGKIVFRTLKGVQVLDAQTGTPLWESPLNSSPEAAYITAQLKGLNTPQARGLFEPTPNTQSFSLYTGTNPDTHPLTSLVYRNANWGSQSSDGQRLFIVESMRLNFGSSGYSHNINRFRRGRKAFEENYWTSNQISAYDLESGQPLWKVGGTRFDEPFDLPLAGTFFFGAPTPAGDELYVVGERNREIRVYALDPQTGEERWSQQIGNPDQDIATDMVRRWWIAPVAVDQGVLVCPTTIGLLTAIDRLNHSVLWSTKYKASNPNNRNQRFRRTTNTSLEPLNQRWSPSTPIITGNKVIYTPPDEDALICLDLITGTPSWTERAKETYLYLAGVVENHILLVGMNGITAISVTTGKTVWNTAFGTSAGPPSGQAVIADQRLHIPLQSGQVWTLDVNSGKVSNKLFSTSSNQPLGNLLIHNGQFLSLSPKGLVSYEQKQTYEAQIKQLKQQNSQSPLALFNESKLLMMSHRYQEALVKLQQLESNKLPAQHQENFQRLVMNCLTSIIRSDFQKHDQLVDQLKQRVRSDKERIELQRLIIERYIARRQFSDALDKMLELAKAPANTFFQTTTTKIQIDCWIAGKASDIWNQADPAFRELFSRKISQSTQQVLSSPLSQQERYHCQFGFHDAVIPVLEALIRTSMNSGRFYETELWITQLTKHKTPHVAARGVASMVELCLKHQLHQDAAYYLEQLSHYDHSFIVSENRPVSQFLELKRHAISIDAEKNKGDWRPEELKLIVGGSARYYHNQENKLNTSASQLPFYRDRRLAVNPKENRLTIMTPFDKRMLWSTPLRSSDHSRSSGFNESEIVGHNLILQHRDMLHFFDLVDQKLIWSQKLEKQRSSSHFSYQKSPPPMGDLATLMLRNNPSIASQKIGMIAAANADYTCYFSRRKIILISTRTGKTRWTHENVDKETRILGDDDFIYLVTPNRVTKKILRASDGKQMELGNTDIYLKNAIYQNDSEFVSIEKLINSIDPLTGQKRPVSKSEISLYSANPQAKVKSWSHAFPLLSQFGIFDAHYLSVLSPKGEVFIVDLQSGKKSALEPVPQAELKKHKNFYLVSDDNYMYFVNHSHSSNVISVSAPSIPVNGMLYVYERQTGKKLWNQSIKEQHLVLNRKTPLPITLLVSRKQKRIDKLKNRPMNIIHLNALDKQTGKSLLSWEAPIQSNIRAVEVDYQQKMIEILTYNARIRLYDADELAVRTLKKTKTTSKIPLKTPIQKK